MLGRKRFSLRNAWNNNYIKQNYPTAWTPLRAINNSGDLLSRRSCSCVGSCQSFQSIPNVHGIKSSLGHVQNQCDNSQIPPSTCNVKWVADVSDYISFLKHREVNRNYNDTSYGGDSSNATQSVIRAIRRY